VQHWNITILATILSGGVLSVLEKANAGRSSSLRGGSDDLVSAAAMRAVEALAARARRHPGVVDALRAGDPLALGEDLERVLAEIGHRGPGETELANATFGDDPAMLLAAVVKRLDQPDRAALAPSAPGGVLGRVTAFAHSSIRARERVRDTTIRTTHHLRLAVRERGRRLAADTTLAAPDDVFYLLYDELLDPPPGIKELIRKRRAERDRLAKLRLPAQFTDRWEPEEPDGDPLGPGEELRGIGASAGRAQGRVRVLDASTMADLAPGEVLVARTTDTGWTPLFACAAAVVTDVGAMFSHQAVVAREFGIPCVVSTDDATVRLRDGQVVEVDGAAGTVRLL
jgi:phosphohistidine swiveling domain-containing protein